MIEIEAFLGDQSSYIKHQANCYGASLLIVRELILEEIQLSDVGKQFEKTHHFDHRPWQFFHDCIADASRYETHLNSDGNRHKGSWCPQLWREEFKMRVKALLVSDQNLAQNLAIAVLKPNPNPDGCAAEEYVDSYVLKEYRSTLIRLRHYRVLYASSEDNVVFLPSS
ncbi:hypothetical protein QUO21_004624 [Vibrio parahaemolyticus]|nr:hypothetical protein [Vibrio parahaemolyticus]